MDKTTLSLDTSEAEHSSYAGDFLRAYVDVTQINLHHAKTATATLCALQESMMKKSKPPGQHTPHSFVALIQEPYQVQGYVKGLGNLGQIFQPNTNPRTLPPRTCIVVSKNIHSVPMSQFIDRDQVVIETTWGQKKIVFASVYMPYEALQPPADKFKELVTYCNMKNLPLVIGADTNAHHEHWGNHDINQRGAELFESIVELDLFVMNIGNKATFQNMVRKEVLDVTFANRWAMNLVRNWHVSDTESYSDHKYVRFAVAIQKPDAIFRRCLNKTNWTVFREELSELMKNTEVSVSSVEDIERLNDSTTNAMVKAFDKACPLRRVRADGKAMPWWNEDISKLWKRARKEYKEASRTGVYEIYKKTRNLLNSSIRKAKRNSWRSFCQDIMSMPETSRIFRICQREGHQSLGAMKTLSGDQTVTDAVETLTVLLDKHYPNDPNQEYQPIHTRDSEKLTIVTEREIERSITSFKPFKAPGPDGIYPAMLQQGIEILKPTLLCIYSASLELGYIPEGWRKCRVVFLPKPGKLTYEEASSWRPISLTSFMLKTMERIIDRYLRRNNIEERLISNNQFAYVRGRSTDAALHRLVANVEKAMYHNEIALYANADIEGAFNNLKISAMEKALEKFDVNPFITRWVSEMLRNRTVIATLRGNTATKVITRGCPQGGVLSPLLWNMVVDELLEGLKSRFPSVISQGFADDISLLQVGRSNHYSTISGRIKDSLRYLKTWCSTKGLNLNLGKTDLILFGYRGRKKLEPITMDGICIPRKETVRYLGVIRDEKLSWAQHCADRRARAVKALATCRRLVGKTWGLSPKLTAWLYTAVVRPVVTYAAVVWVTATDRDNRVIELTRIQRLACLCITGANRSTSTSALEALTGLIPIDIHLRGVALKTMVRLQRHGSWHFNKLRCGSNSHVGRSEGPLRYTSWRCRKTQ